MLRMGESEDLAVGDAPLFLYEELLLNGSDLKIALGPKECVIS